MRACEPSYGGFVVRDGVKVCYEVFGQGEPTVLLLPTWSVIHSRQWKFQVSDLARRARVVTFDGRGNGCSDRPSRGAAYRPSEFAADSLAVMDATGTDRAVLFAFSFGARWGLELASSHPDRVLGIVFLGPSLPIAPRSEDRETHSFTDPLDTTEGWAKFNEHYWREHYQDFLEFFFSELFSERHSTKAIDDCVGWGLETDPQTLAASVRGAAKPVVGSVSTEEGACAKARALTCPVLVVHGDEDRINPIAMGERLAELTGAPILRIQGGGHAPHVRDPVRFNLAVREFLALAAPVARRGETSPRRWTRALRRRPRALYLSSPIGLGHVRRDVAIARELRTRHPDLQVDWLAQDPVSRVLVAEGELVHPASRLLVSESAHIESESAEHDLHCFQAIRRMDEILVSNFMVFNDVVVGGEYDLVIGDEAWEVDHFLHENPELKRTAFAWMTDFVGWLPMPDGGAREAYVTADYNAEMIEHIARFPRLRDRAIFVGNPHDIVPERLGPDLPGIREWTEEHFSFSGYISGFDPDGLDREAVREQLGYRPGEPVCVVSVGGSGVGTSLLRRIVAAYPLAERAVPGLRMVVVTGPRIDPASVPAPAGVEVHGYVPRLYRHLLACDLAVVQGGLTTCMELAAARRPFHYYPLAHHFEQTIHVPHRLDRYRAGRRIDFATADPDLIAATIAEDIGRSVDYLPVEKDGAARAAHLIAELI